MGIGFSHFKCLVDIFSILILKGLPAMMLGQVYRYLTRMQICHLRVAHEKIQKSRQILIKTIMPFHFL